MIKKFFNFILESVQALVLALSVFVLLYLFVAQPNQVHGNSMVPNFQDNEFLLTEKLTYLRRLPKRGEVVIFKAPPSEPCAENECEYIKRVIGLPGESITVKDGSVYINDNRLEENYLPSSFQTGPGSYLREGRTVEIPQGEYIMMGDNRPHSRDSREFGPIPRESIVGRAFFSYWPVDNLGLIKHAKYNLQSMLSPIKIACLQKVIRYRS
jgi:signal peptidase I